MKRKLNDYAISEVIGTNLLILVTMIMFSLLLTSVFTIFEPNVEPPSANILCQVNENNIKLNHIGGESLSTDTKIILEIGQGVTQEYTVNDYLDNDLKSNGWEFGESLLISSIETYGREIKINLLDKNSNSFIFSSTIPSPTPLITIVNSIAQYFQTSSPLAISAVSTETSPDNISLWYKWEGLWEDTFVNDNTYVLNYHNMSFSAGDFASVNVSGIEQEIEEIVDNDISNVDGSSDIGSHSNYNNQKLKDGTSDILTEGNTGGGYINDILLDSFEGNPWNDNWDDTVSNWYISNLQSHSGTYSVGTNNGNEGYFDCNELNTSDTDLIIVDFWYLLNNTESSDFQIYYYNGLSWNLIDSIGGNSEDIWLHYTDTISDSQYFISNFRIRLNSNLGNNENFWIDNVNIEKSVSGSINYEIDLEIQWLNVNYQLPYEELCIYVSSISNENLLLDIWNTSNNSWDNLINNLTIGWNNLSINDSLTSSTYTIRFYDSLKNNDTDQNIWGIDVALLHVWEQTGNLYYEGNMTSIDITKPIHKNWSFFNANVQNLEKCALKILDENNNLLMDNLDGLNNNISTINNDIIRLYAIFNDSNKLYSWEVSYGNQDWSEYNVDTNGSDGWNWNFDFNLGSGIYSFYSIGEKNGWYDEEIPISPDYDTKCYYLT